jgi:hypothetical protein
MHVTEGLPVVMNTPATCYSYVSILEYKLKHVNSIDVTLGSHNITIAVKFVSEGFRQWTYCMWEILMLVAFGQMVFFLQFLSNYTI